MGQDFDDLLRTLDFNGANSGDLIAREYFRQSASAIRALRSDRDHYLRCYMEESSINIRISRDARRLERELTQAIEARSGETEGLDPKDESAVRQDAPEPSASIPAKQGE